MGIGHPLLDLSAQVDTAFLEKYGLENGSAQLAEAHHMPLFAELAKKASAQFIAGGSSLNTIRVTQWILGDEQSTGFVGAVGDDKFGELLLNRCQADGVDARFQTISSDSTGLCACSIWDRERTMVTRLGAADRYRTTHMDPALLALKGGIVYSTAYFLNCEEGRALFRSKELAADSLHCFNLAAPYLQEKFRTKIDKIVRACDVVFCNEEEAAAYARAHDLEDTSASAVAKYIAAEPRTKNTPRIAVVTQGAKSTIVARTDGMFMEIPVPRIAKERIVDLNAAGDAFVGGFLAGLARDGCEHTCVIMAHRAAGYIIQQPGCTFSGTFDETVE